MSYLLESIYGFCRSGFSTTASIANTLKPYRPLIATSTIVGEVACRVYYGTYPLFESAYGLCRSGFSMGASIARTLKPYQPLIATGTIVGKLVYRIYQWDKVTDGINQYNTLIGVLTDLLTTNAGKLDEGNVKQLKNRITALQTKRDALQESRNNTKFSFWQLPSLLDPHPGLNTYNEIFNLVNRTLWIKQKMPTPELTTAQKTFVVSIGVISLLGTGVSLLCLTGFADRENRFNQTALNLGLGATVIEGAALAKQWIVSKIYPEKPVILDLSLPSSP